MFLKTYGLAMASLLMLVAAGCDDRPRRYPVSGTVVVDGEPVPIGMIRFWPEGARASTGAIDAEGRFTMTCYEENDGVIAGSHRVSVFAGEPLSATKVKWHAPKKYANPETSGLTATIEEDTQDLVIELTWDGGKPFVEVSGRGEEKMSEDM